MPKRQTLILGVVGLLLGFFLFLSMIPSEPRPSIELTDIETEFVLPLFRDGECSANSRFKLVNRGDADGFAEVHLLVFSFSVVSEQYFVLKHSSLTESLTDPASCRGLTSSSPLEQFPPIKVVIVRVFQ